MTPELRALFPVTERLIYFNHAAISPPPIPTIRAIEAQLKDVQENGSLNFRSWLAVKEDSRKLLASLLGARPEQVAFVRNTSDALSTGARGTISSHSVASFLPTFIHGLAFATFLDWKSGCARSAMAGSMCRRLKA